MNRKDLNAEYEKELIKREKETPFPAGQLPPQYYAWFHIALQFVSVADMRMAFTMKWIDFRALIQKQREFSLFDVFIINQLIQMVRPNDWQKLSPDNYYDVQQQIINVSSAWNDIMAPITKAVESRINISAGLKPDYHQSPVRNINGSDLL